MWERLIFTVDVICAVVERRMELRICMSHVQSCWMEELFRCKHLSESMRYDRLLLIMNLKWWHKYYRIGALPRRAHTNRVSATKSQVHSLIAQRKDKTQRLWRRLRRVTRQTLRGRFDQTHQMCRSHSHFPILMKIPAKMRFSVCWQLQVLKRRRFQHQ